MKHLNQEAFRTLDVMLVDDDPTFRHFLEAQLEPLGFSIVSVDSGEAAWDRIQNHPPDLVLTDVFMPGMSGLDLCRKIKASPELQDIPVVLLTMAGAKAKDEGFKAGADDFLNKPPHLMELRSRLHNLLLLRSYQLLAVPETEPPPPPSEPPTPPRILMVESYGILNSYVGMALTEEGWSFSGVREVDAFLEALEADPPDLAIIDQDLIEGPGTALVERLHNQATTANLPVLLVCDPGSLGPEHLAWSAGADDLLAKPFEASELKARVRTLLRQAQYRNQLDARHLQADRSALRDPRSGAYTRAFLYASLDTLCGFATLTRRPMSLLAYRLSDTERSRPRELRQVVGLLKNHLLAHEFLCRVEEDLFVAVLPGVDARELSIRVSDMAHHALTGQFSGTSSLGEQPSLVLKRLWQQVLPSPGR